MLETVKNVWKFAEKRHSTFVKSLVFSFLRSAFSACQLIALIISIKALTFEYQLEKAIISVSVLVAVCVIGNFVTSYFEQTNSICSSFYMISDKRITVAEKLKRFPLGFFNNNSCGKITATLTTTMSDVETASVMIAVGIISGIFNSLSLIVLIFFYEWKIGLVTLLGTILYLFTVAYQMKLSRKNAPKRQKAQSKLAESAINFVSGIKVTKAFSFKDGDKALKKSISDSRKENIKLTDRSMPSQLCAQFTIVLFESAILLLAILLFTNSGEIDIVKVTVLIIFSFTAYSALNQAGSMLSMIGMLESGIDEVKEIESQKTIEIQKPIEKANSYDIVFDNVSFSYGNNEILHNITTEFKQNTLTAIIGPSGSGKTTLCSLIPRMRDVTSGRITIGGADISHMSEEDLQSKISMVFQKVYLFEDTVLNNIRFANPCASEEDVIRVAKLANCHDFIMKMKNGYNTVLDEGGNSLSGGEKQRISIARAMLKDAPIIILDEATSALDAECESEVLSAINELTKNKTVIMIAHRIKTVENANKIIALKNRVIAEEGTAEELIKIDGIFKSFVNSRNKAKGWKISNGKK